VILFDASNPPYRERHRVATCANGKFDFSDIPQGQYIVQVRIRERARHRYHGVMHSYHGKTYKWEKANILNVTCGDSSSITIDMVESTVEESGDGKACGHVYHKNGMLKTTPLPVKDALVMIINSATEMPVGYVSTDSDGNYEITGIAQGSYTLYVDIAGLVLETTHEFTVSENLSEYYNLDFEVDDAVYFDINALNDISTDVNKDDQSYEVTLYPNPAREYVYVRSAMFNGSVAELTLISQAGAIVRTMSVGGAETITGQVELDLTGVSSGQYLLKIESDGKVAIKKVIVRN
jgi:hypothetical protein